MTHVIHSAMNRPVDPRMTHVRNRAPALFQMPHHMWQSKLDRTNPYHSSHCDRVQLGWQKWGADYPNFYARRAEATVPDWYSRRVETIRGGDTKERLWAWELTSRPTEKRAYGIGRESPRPWQRGYQAVPHEIQGQVQMPRHGLYNPPHYTEPSRVEPLPPMHVDMKHL